MRIINTLKDIYVEKGKKGYFFNLLFFLKIYLHLKIFRLFAGIVPRVSMISLGGFIFFGVYEKTKKTIENYWF